MDVQSLDAQSRLVSYMNDKGYKKCRVAEAVGINLNRFSKICNFHTKMTTEEFEKTCKYFGASPKWFVLDPLDPDALYKPNKEDNV